MSDPLLPEFLEPLLKGTIFSAPINHYDEIGSTNSAAMQAASQGAPQGSVFIAERQIAGRGRGTHTWHSPSANGIYCSVVLRPALSPSQALIFSLAAGLAVHAAVQELSPRITPDLKWPNDLLIGGKKFCGILTEMNAEATRVRYIVVGIGINVNHSQFPPELKDTATSLRIATNSQWPRLQLCAALLKSLDREYRNLTGSDAATAQESVINRFEARSSYAKGRAVTVEENGNFEGITEGLDSRGFLLVRTAEGLRTVLSGTVRAK